MTHWAEAYLGLPWEAGVSDCWHLAARVWRERFGWEVAPVSVDAADPRAARRAFARRGAAAGWRGIPRRALRDGDAVLMARGRWPCHVGVAVLLPEGPACLHALEGAGSVIVPLGRIADAGYRIDGFWRHAEAGS